MENIFSIRRRFQFFFFIKFAAIGVFAPYMALYFTRKGMSGIEMGMILGMMPLVKMFVQPVFSLIGDIYHAQRALMFYGCLATALTVSALYLVDQFVPILMLMAAFSAMDTPAEPIVNALSLDYLEKEKQKSDFASLRLWGSAGFALASFFGGWLFSGSLLVHLPLVYALLLVVSAFLCLTMPVGAAKRTPTWLEGIKILPDRPSLSLFLLGIVFVSAPLNVGVQYMSVYLEDLNALSWLVGFIVAIQAVLEVPMMAKTPQITRRIGLKAALLTGVLLLPLRWLSYLFIRDAWLVIPTQLLHATAIVSVQVVAVEFVDRLVPHEWRSTGQGLLATAFRGMGPSLGLFVSGFAYQEAGMRGVWFFCLVFSLIGAVAVDAALRIPAARRALLKEASPGI